MRKNNSVTQLLTWNIFFKHQKEIITLSRLLPLVFLLSSLNVLGQESRFKKEVEQIQIKYDSIWDNSKETVVFTGSSSIRLWKELDELFPNHQIVNTGFGASQSADLLEFTQELIVNFNPQKVFIYEGDNDIAGGIKPKEIIKTTKEILHQVWEHNPSIEIVLISAKPSITRWEFKKKYKRLNRKFKKYSNSDSRIQFLDVWSPMLLKNKLNTSLFIEDGLHMNAKGYAIWQSLVQSYLIN